MAKQVINEIDPQLIARIMRAVRKIEAADKNAADSSVVSPYNRTVPIANQSGYAIPQYGVVWLTGLTTDNATHIARRPAYGGISRVGIATSEIPVNGKGRCWVDGLQTIRADDYSGTDVGDRLGALKDSFNATPDTLGVFTVLAKLQEPYVKALITSDRGDEVYLDYDDVSHSYQHIRFDPAAFSLTEVSPGVCLVDYVTE
jgi:hypothetical protein